MVQVTTNNEKEKKKTIRENGKRLVRAASFTMYNVNMYASASRPFAVHENR